MSHRGNIHASTSGRTFEMHPGSRVAPVVHRVIDQPYVPAHGGTQTRSREIRFRCDGVLLITEIVADERQHFEQHLAEVGRVRFLPFGQNGGHAILHQAAETLVILGKIRNVYRGRRGWAGNSVRADNRGCLGRRP